MPPLLPMQTSKTRCAGLCYHLNELFMVLYFYHEDTPGDQFYPSTQAPKPRLIPYSSCPAALRHSSRKHTFLRQRGEAISDLSVCQ